MNRYELYYLRENESILRKARTFYRDNVKPYVKSAEDVWHGRDPVGMKHYGTSHVGHSGTWRAAGIDAEGNVTMHSPKKGVELSHVPVTRADVEAIRLHDRVKKVMHGANKALTGAVGLGLAYHGIKKGAQLLRKKPTSHFERAKAFLDKHDLVNKMRNAAKNPRNQKIAAGAAGLYVANRALRGRKRRKESFYYHGNLLEVGFFEKLRKLADSPLVKRVKNIGQKTEQAKEARAEGRALDKKYKAIQLAKNPHNKSPLIAAYDKSRIRKKIHRMTVSIGHKMAGTPDPRPRPPQSERIDNVVNAVTGSRPVRAAKFLAKAAGAGVGAYGAYRFGKHLHGVYKARQAASRLSQAATRAAEAVKAVKHRRKIAAIGASAIAGGTGLALLKRRHDQKR